MARKNKICWVWREDRWGPNENVAVSPTQPILDGWNMPPSWDSRDATSMCYAFFLKATGLRLKDGADPIRVRFSVEVLP